MELSAEKLSTAAMRSRFNIRVWISQVPLLGWLFGALVAVGLEMAIGTPLARGLGLPKIPVLFGLVIMLKKPLLIPSTLLYLALVYLLPISLVCDLFHTDSYWFALFGLAPVVRNERLSCLGGQTDADRSYCDFESECGQRLYG